MTVNLYGGNCPADPSRLTVANRLKTTTTNANGVYTFSGLMPGEYCIAADNGTLPTPYHAKHCLTAGCSQQQRHRHYRVTLAIFQLEPEIEITRTLLSSLSQCLVGQEVELQDSGEEIGDTIIRFFLQDRYDPTMFEYLERYAQFDDTLTMA